MNTSADNKNNQSSQIRQRRRELRDQQIILGDESDVSSEMNETSGCGRVQKHTQLQSSNPKTVGTNRNRSSGSRGIRKFLIRTTVIGVAVGIVLFGLWKVNSSLGNFFNEFTKSDYSEESTQTTTVEIPKGASGEKIGQILLDAGVVKSVSAFKDAFTNNPSSTKIQAGTYKLPIKTSASKVINLLISTESKIDSSILIPPGFTIWQVKERLAKQYNFSEKEIDQALKDISIPDQANGNPEGWIAPNTYNVNATDKPLDVLQKMVDEQLKVLKSIDITSSQYQHILTVASIIEREVGKPEYYGKVARVIENRLQTTGETHGLLQMDSTVLYGVGKTGGIPTTADFNDPNPYNTYLNKGIPPTPIGSPSKDVISAAINPPAGGWYYFVTVNLDTGETLFSTTYDEHIKNVEKFRFWQSENNNQ